MEKAKGTVIQVMGPVLDIRFPDDQLPELLNAIEIDLNGDKLVVVDSLEDYIIADAGDVLLICPKANEQSIKQMVNDAKVTFGDKYL